jgi:hypothetical protein
METGHGAHECKTSRFRSATLLHRRHTVALRPCLIDRAYCGESTRVFKGNYQERPVAVKVVQLYSSNREETLRVGVPSCLTILMVFLICGPEILQRGDDLETPPTPEYPSVDWSYA